MPRDTETITLQSRGIVSINSNAFSVVILIMGLIVHPMYTRVKHYFQEPCARLPEAIR
jgi:hypothetical protein